VTPGSTVQDSEPDVPHHQVVVVGAGQAGLSVSWHLQREGIDHVVLERHRAGHEWREHRWDSFCLVTPNWQCQLPGWPYRGDDPDGFMVRHEIVDYLDGFIASFAPPLREGVDVTALSRTPFSRFRLATSAGELTAEHVVIASGGYQVPIIPRFAERLPEGILQMHSQDYKNADQLPPGGVLVVGSGQSGAQLAEDLHLAGRRVHLCLGDAPRVARFYRGADVVKWLHDIGYYETTADERSTSDGERARANHYVTGRDGGRDIDLRRFAVEGMRLYGTLEDYVGGELRFTANLGETLDMADAVSEGIKDSIDAHIAKNGIDAPVEERYTPVWEPEHEPASLDLEAAGVTSIVWAIGFRPDYGWVGASVFDGRGRPVHRRGVTADPGVYFVGLPWLWTWGSARFSGVARDAEHLVDVIKSRCQASHARTERELNALAYGD